LMASKQYVFRKKINTAGARILDGFGDLLLRRRSREPRFGRVLVVRLDHLGDVLTATAIPRLVKEAYPEARVTFLAAGWAAPLLENNPYLEEILTYDASWFAKGRTPSGKGGFWATAKELAGRNFDLALAPRGDIRENFLLYRAKIPSRAGYGITGGGFLLTKEAVYRPGVHETEHTTDLLKAVGIRGAYPGPQVYFTPAEETAWGVRAASLGLSPEGRFVGFQTGAGTPAKEWGSTPALQFIAATRSLGITIVLTGTEKDRARAPFHGESGVIDLRGKTSLRELCLFMKSCRAFVGPDSGPTHLASALGVPAVFLYSGTNRFEEWRPLASNARVLRHPVPCAPCALEECPIQGHPCMTAISPDDTVRLLAEALA
jgi:heptosyltransferase-2